MLRRKGMLRSLRRLHAAALHSGLLASGPHQRPSLPAQPAAAGPPMPSSSGREAASLLAEKQRASGRGAGHRCFSASAAAGQGPEGSHRQGPSLKAALRNLYRLIHPDFFHDFPAERQENERSFALLQEYLSAMECHSGSNEVFDFVFYLRNAPHSAATPTASAQTKCDTEGAEVLEGLYKVSVSLPPPSPAHGRKYSRTSQLALGKLLRAVGLSPDFEFSRDTNGNSDIGRALHEVIQENAETVRRRQTTNQGIRTQLSLARTALRMGRRVQFSVGSTAGIGTKEEERDLFIKFAATCDMLPHMRMEGLRVCLGAGYGVDVGGVLWLDAKDEASEWAPWMEANEASARARAAAAAQLQAQEAHVAQSLGISMLFASRVLTLSPEYIEFLQSAVAAAAMYGPIGGESRPFCTVPICIVAHGAGTGGQEPYALSKHGLLTCPVGAPLKDVYDFVQRKGTQAAHILSSKAREEQEMQDLVAKVRKSLRLRHLVRDKYLPPVQFKACCHQLLQHQRQLGSVVDGLSICVSDANGISQDGDMVALKWNYTL